MPIVDPEIIKSGEKKLFASILESFDEYKIEKIAPRKSPSYLKRKDAF